MRTRRIFAAVDISDEARASAGKYIDELRRRFPDTRAGWIGEEKLHITVKFFGDVTDEELAKATSAVRSAAAENRPFQLVLEGTGLFPSRRRARVLWVGIGGEVKPLEQISTAIEREAGRLGLPSGDRRFDPHLTIARLRDSRNSVPLIDAHLTAAFGPAEFPVGSISLYESRLNPSGSVYSRLDRLPLLG